MREGISGIIGREEAASTADMEGSCGGGRGL